MMISIIIPCKNAKSGLQDLKNDIARQKISGEREVIIVTDVSPAASARNKGAKQAQGKVLVFCDADIRIDDKLLLDKLIKPLMEDKNIAMSCAAVRIPKYANKFQRRYAQEIPLAQTKIAAKLTDVFQVPAACCAIIKETFNKIGGFNEKLIRGEDPELSRRLQKSGYRLVLVPDAWYYHPVPANFLQLVRVHVRNGKAVACVDKFHPELNVDLNQQSITEKARAVSKPYRLFRFVAKIVTSIFSLKCLFVIAKICYGVGYIIESFYILFGFYKKRHMDG